MEIDYNKTLNLPQTAFSMRAALPQREPAMVRHWDESGRYEAIIGRVAQRPAYILHDGPPYANGDIHLGTALNKVLKDIVVRYKNLSGFRAEYVPGWDTHGLPIERKALQKLGVDRAQVSPTQLRKSCREFALHYVDVQREQFKRLGVMGDFSHPYRTLDPAFEARQIEVFGEMAEKGYIYKGLKPVYWCSECGTAIAEAEIEYSEDACDSIYVKFAVEEDNGFFERMGIDRKQVFFVIWTTTTWTLPGNLAICLGSKYAYCLAKANGEYYVLAHALAETTMAAAGITEYEIMGQMTGKELENILCTHPFLERTSRVIVGDHVTLDSGTGCVHTAPGHGVEDYEVCVNHYPDIGIVVPVDGKGILTQEAGAFVGLTTTQANAAIRRALQASGHLLALQKIKHPYPHCWRCQEPILYRATEQWFCSIDAFKGKAVEAIHQVRWIPEWGKGRMTNMVSDRSDWCISRQRIWGVPLPIFYCETCGKEHINVASIAAVSALIRDKGSDAWFTTDVRDILPVGSKCAACGCETFTKETDIMDVWFDSGCSHTAVLDQRENLSWPADLYLEGADQYRGWFQSSLLTAVALGRGAPYRVTCTHGWVVDGEGRKMSKSLGNGIAPEDIINKYGADILRLWVASSDYHADIRISNDILGQLSESYRKIRNTARYILGNLDGFHPQTDRVPFEELPELDKWALVRLEDVTAKACAAYDVFDFYIVYHTIHQFCTTDLSSFYLDVIKDRLYIEKSEGKPRRCAQSVMYEILHSLTLLLTPILCFTAEEIWSYLPHDENDNPDSVMFNDMPVGGRYQANTEFAAKWEQLARVRSDVNKALELARARKEIGKSLEARIVLYCTGALYDFAAAQNNWAEILIVSQVQVEAGGEGTFRGEMEDLSVDVLHASGSKCERCWIYSETVSQNAEHPSLCARCAGVVGNV